MDYRIQNVKYKVSDIKKSLKYKNNRMNKFEYKFANSLYNNLKNSLDSGTDDDFEECFYAYSGKCCENKLLYSTILEFNFYKDKVNLSSSNFHSSVVVNKLKEMLIESNINIHDLTYYYNEALFYELIQNRENPNDKDVIVKVSVSCVLQFDYLSFPELLAHRILKSNFVQSLCRFFR